MMDWVTGAAACGKSDFVQMSDSRQALLPLPQFQALCFSLSHKIIIFFLTSFFPPFNPTVLSLPSYASPFSHLSSLSLSRLSSGLFLRVHFHLVESWQEGGTKSIKILSCKVWAGIQKSS